MLGLLAGLVIPIIYGDAFRPSAEPLLWLLPGTTAFGMATVCAAYIAGTGQPRLNLWVALGGLAVTAVLDLILIPTRGIVGAAVASTVSYSFTAVVTTWLVMRHAGLPLLSLVLPTGDDLQAGLALIRSVFGRLLMAI